MPSRGRTKVYLIDEVHMLSKQAFNALLKTLEEPPGHVKFLLATTDPQKLPVTVLSRCLQFNLRRLDEAQIGGQIGRILEAEQISAEPAAIALLARAADGSLRDGLSLLDQAIAYTGGQLEEAAVIAMLGSVDRSRIAVLLEALVAGDGAALLAGIDELASYSPDFGNVLEDLALALHRIQLRQMVPGMADEAGQVEVATFAQRLTPELVQLWYQMAVTGRRDLGLAPSQRTGFEMALLRMLAFRPAGEGAAAITAAAAGASSASAAGASGPAAVAATAPAPAMRTSAAPTTTARAPERPVAAAPASAADRPATPDAAPRGASAPLTSVEDWLSLVAGAGLKGPVRELAAHSAFCGHADGVLQLSLPDSFDHLRSDNLVRQLAQALAPALGNAPKIRFESAKAAGGDTLHARSERQRDQRQADAESAFLSDPVVSRLVQQGATVVPDSVRPLDEH
jgi:DNA polymerase-3 subunit gamma/tau